MRRASALFKFRSSGYGSFGAAETVHTERFAVGKRLVCRRRRQYVELEGIEPSSAKGLQPAIRPFPIHCLTAAVRLGPLDRSLAAGSFSDVSGLSRRQWSFPTVLHCFCCRAAVNRPRVTFLLAMTL